MNCQRQSAVAAIALGQSRGQRFSTEASKIVPMTYRTCLKAADKLPMGQIWRDIYKIHIKSSFRAHLDDDSGYWLQFALRELAIMERLNKTQQSLPKLSMPHSLIAADFLLPFKFSRDDVKNTGHVPPNKHQSNRKNKISSGSELRNESKSRNRNARVYRTRLSKQNIDKPPPIQSENQVAIPPVPKPLVSSPPRPLGLDEQMQLQTDTRKKILATLLPKRQSEEEEEEYRPEHYRTPSSWDGHVGAVLEGEEDAFDYYHDEEYPIEDVHSNQSEPTDSVHLVEKWLKELVPHLRREDVNKYALQLAKDGFDSIYILENELKCNQEDLSSCDVAFMKKAHRRSFINAYKQKYGHVDADKNLDS